jgi:DNA-binding transcriptional LysR family regulator
VDLNLARTFLEIVASGNFMRAAERLHVTQTAVSARVRSLEELLGRPLFVRNKAGASLTPAGERFLRHAQTLVQVWERARHQVAVPAGRRAVVTLGCEMSLWAPLLLEWLLWMRRAAPQLALHTEVGIAGALLDQVADGTLDIAVMYAPQQRPGLAVELLIQEKLVFVTTSRSKGAPRPADYVHVDWGREFALQHSRAFPELANAAVSAGLGPLGREYLLQAGGSGYFRQGVVRDHIARGRLRLVKDAPVFLYPAYAVYSETADSKVVAPALAGLRHVANAAAGQSRRAPKRTPMARKARR